MKQNKEIRISYLSAHLTTIVSVTLVLVIVGIIALITMAASREARRLQERIEVSAILADSISDAQAEAMARKLAALPAVKQAKMISREQAMEEWSRQTGENLSEIFGVNPFSPEISLVLNSQYTHPDSIAALQAEISADPAVEEVAIPDAQLVEGMNAGIRRIVWILGPIALAMLLISFVLINNTVRLAIYSRRFTIHTMQLVGATDAFIRRPFVLRNMLTGVISGVLASAILCIALAAGRHSGVLPASMFYGWTLPTSVLTGLVAIGAAICAFAAWLATRRHLRADYDDLFK